MNAAEINLIEINLTKESVVQPVAPAHAAPRIGLEQYYSEAEFGFLAGGREPAAARSHAGADERRGARTTAIR
jgi:hypothetical protein